MNEVLDQLFLRLKHNVTFYHFRHSGYVRLSGKRSWLPKAQHTTILSHCSCGWKAWMWRKLHWRMRFRWLYRCSWRGCDWEIEHPVQTGQVYQDDEGTWRSEIDDDPIGTTIGYIKQCKRCWRCVMGKEELPKASYEES